MIQLKYSSNTFSSFFCIYSFHIFYVYAFVLSLYLLLYVYPFYLIFKQFCFQNIMSIMLSVDVALSLAILCAAFFISLHVIVIFYLSVFGRASFSLKCVFSQYSCALCLSFVVLISVTSSARICQLLYCFIYYGSKIGPQFMLRIWDCVLYFVNLLSDLCHSLLYIFTSVLFIYLSKCCSYFCRYSFLIASLVHSILSCISSFCFYYLFIFNFISFTLFYWNLLNISIV